jgi:hypothetical protein
VLSPRPFEDDLQAVQLKANSDLGIPVIGVGLLYQQGYFRQVIDKDGATPLFPLCCDFAHEN